MVKRDGVLHSMVRGLFWPLGIVVRSQLLSSGGLFFTFLHIGYKLAGSLSQVRAYRGFWWVLGYRQPQETILLSPTRHSLTGRKRLHRFTRLLLSILPRWVQGALGYPVSSSIGRSLSPGRLLKLIICAKTSFKSDVHLTFK